MLDSYIYMGIFNDIFGGTGSRYSQNERQLSAEEIRSMVSRYRTQSLDAKEETLIEDALIRRRKGNGKISLRQVDEVLRSLEGKKKISQHDRSAIMRIFEKRLGKK